MERKLVSLEDTKKFLLDVFETISSKKNTDGATFLLLRGDLGVGKTASTKILAEILGISEIIKSPTFILRFDYRTSNEFFKRLIHIDAYRLEKDYELDTIAFPEVIKMKDALVVVEWPERIEKFLPKKHFLIDMSLEKGVRNFNFKEV